MTDSNRILELFKNNNEKRFMPFLVAGDPNMDQFIKLAKIIEPYSDILEIGIPFSDPIADGPTIQEANVRAFDAGINTDKAIAAIKELRNFTAKPIVILTYYNILIQGANTIEASLDLTFKKLKEAGVDGLVIADLPIEEAELALSVCKKYDLALIFLVAPSTTDDRLDKILKVAKGFLYLVAVMGVTGVRDVVHPITEETLKRVRQKNQNNIPIFVGFGISGEAHAAYLCNVAGVTGIIIGSAIVKIIKNNLDNFSNMEQDLEKFVSGIRDAVKRR